VNDFDSEDDNSDPSIDSGDSETNIDPMLRTIAVPQQTNMPASLLTESEIQDGDTDQAVRCPES